MKSNFPSTHSREHRIYAARGPLPALGLAAVLALSACVMDAGEPDLVRTDEIDVEIAAEPEVERAAQPEAQRADLTGDIGTLQAQPGTFALGWVWADQPNAALNTPYTTSTLYQSNLRFDYVGTPPMRQYTPPATNTVTRLGTGSYRVTFPNLGVSGGTVHITAYGGNHHCKVSSWGPGSGGMNVSVRCFDPAGVAVNGRFTALFYKDGDMGSQIYSNAYLWADQPSATACYTPSTAYQFNSRSEINTMCRLGTGEYEATLPRMEKHMFEPSAGGHLQVTAYGAGAERCKVRNWFQVGTSLRARVGCVNSSGGAVDARFTLSFLRSPGTLATSVAEDTLEGYFVWANATPAPNNLYQSDSYGNQDATMQQTGTGPYLVHLPNVKAFDDSTALVTAYGSGDAHCNVDGWLSDGASGTTVIVRCFNSAGTPVSSQFNLLYLTNRIFFY